MGGREGPEAITVNGRRYARPRGPVVAICLDGCAPEYLTRAMEAGAMPNLAAMLPRGTLRVVDAVVPTYTNPNNISIVTGVPPAVHGICGNTFYDRETDTEVMMNDPRYLRAGTILAAFGRAGASVAVVTAKDKLRRLLGHGLGGICFSAEAADRTTAGEHGLADAVGFVGRPRPPVYGTEPSEFVLAAGVRLVESIHPDLVYLSTTDYVQHTHAPGTPAANGFCRMVDGYLGRLDALGVTLAVTADHGMSAKADAAGAPRVIYLQDLLDGWLGPGRARVILPITDPYVLHHGALGSFVTVYASGADAGEIAGRIASLRGIELVIDRDAGCRRFELPPDRMGDLLVVADRDTVVGASAARHDLSGLRAPLRSHGGLAERQVPLVLNRPTPGLAPGAGLRNLDLFDLALNHAAATS
jgi:phosphonoacetate hydrolase